MEEIIFYIIGIIIIGAFIMFQVKKAKMEYVDWID
jgi:hypothetical protein